MTQSGSGWTILAVVGGFLFWQTTRTIKKTCDSLIVMEREAKQERLKRDAEMQRLWEERSEAEIRRVCEEVLREHSHSQAKQKD